MSKANKQHDARSASFKRIAAGLKTRSTSFKRAVNGTPDDYAISEALAQVSQEIAAEAKKLRGFR